MDDTKVAATGGPFEMFTQVTVPEAYFRFNADGSWEFGGMPEGEEYIPYPDGRGGFIKIGIGEKNKFTHDKVW